MKSHKNNSYVSNPVLLEMARDDYELKKKRRKSLKNFALYNLNYFLIYSGFWSLTNLQSTMNSSGGLGDYAQAVIYICSMFSCLLLPKFLIDKFGCKKVLVVGGLACCFSIGSNMYLEWNLMISAAVVFGITNGPFVSAQSVYIDEMATRFQSTITENMDFVMATFFGLSLFCSENIQIWGNLVSSLMLGDPSKNASISNSSICGYRFDPTDRASNSNMNLTPPTDQERFLLVGVFLGVGLFGVLLMILFLDPLENDLKEGSGCKSTKDRLMATTRHLKNPQQMLLVPISIYIGMEASFYNNEITQAYIACSWGINHVGFVTIGMGVSGALTGLAVGPVVRCTSQMAVIILAAVEHVVVCIVLFLWEPNPDQVYMYFVIACGWGTADAIFFTQITALHGLLFPNDREAAFSNLNFFSFCGFFLTYSYANYFSTTVKINILLCFLLLGMLGYMVGQIMLKNDTRREYVSIPEPTVNNN